MTPRNAPTVINAAFHPRTFLDGRANETFTWPTAPETTRLEHSTLVSQAVVPPLNTVEMSHPGRTWTDIARKLLPARPLAGQMVAADDSVLGGLDRSINYRSLIRAAFQPPYVEADEVNFPLFFGLAIQAYETTLVADDTPFDRFLEGQRTAMTDHEVSGFLIFQTKAFCQFCHSGPEMSRSSATFTSLVGAVDAVQSGTLDNVSILYTDTGFLPDGRAARVGGPGPRTWRTGPAPRYRSRRGAGTGRSPSPERSRSRGYERRVHRAVLPQRRAGDARAGRGLLRARGRLPRYAGTAGAARSDAHERAQRQDLATFLRSGLTDERVRFERAPFDHPELCVPDGARWVEVPAVGRGGNAAPLQTFEELLKGMGADGSRAHSLTEPCRVILP